MVKIGIGVVSLHNNNYYYCVCVHYFLRSLAHMWFDNKIFEADTTEDQSGTPMEKVLK